MTTVDAPTETTETENTMTTFTVENTCPHCDVDCMECGEGFMEDYFTLHTENAVCPNCGATGDLLIEREHSYDCDCVQININYANECFAHWQQHNPAPYGVYTLTAKHLGWRRVPGYMTIDEDENNIIALLDIDTEWTIDLDNVLNAELYEQPIDNVFHITRSHHDAPTGETIVVRPASFEEALRHIWGGECDSWAEDTLEFLEQHYSPEVCSAELLREVCEDIDCDPQYFTDPEHYAAQQ